VKTQKGGERMGQNGQTWWYTPQLRSGRVDDPAFFISKAYSRCCMLSSDVGGSRGPSALGGLNDVRAWGTHRYCRMMFSTLCLLSSLSSPSPRLGLRSICSQPIRGVVSATTEFTGEARVAAA
jgi:hypothetical protein